MWLNNKFKCDDVVIHVLDPERKGIVDAIVIEREAKALRYRVQWGPGYVSTEVESDLKIEGTFNQDTLDHIDDYPYGDGS